MDQKPPKRVSVSVCPNEALSLTTVALQDAPGRLTPQDSNVVALSFALGATVADSCTKIWNSSSELVAYLLEFDLITTFSGERFDFTLLAADVARENGVANDPQALVNSDEFAMVFNELHKRSYDLYKIIVGSGCGAVNLGNVSQTTLEKPQTTTLSDIAGKPLGMEHFNYVLEGAVLVSDLHYVALQMKQLAVTGPDDKVVVIDLP